MSDKSAIEWTDTTWNPVTGCSKVSPGCAHCYAETLTRRFQPGSLPWTPANAAANVRLHPERVDAPLRWRKPRRVFVNSMSDLFHEAVSDAYLDRVFAIMARTPQHVYQVLTKRPARMLRYLSGADGVEITGWPLPNVWLGVSVENQRWADERVPLLVQTPAAVRFVSCEPLLGPLSLYEWLEPGCTPACLMASIAPGHAHVSALDWVIVGGESGPKRRSLELSWVRVIREQCRRAGVAYFGKQLGGARPGAPLPGELGDREWPQ